MPRNKYPEQTVEKILDAAAALFAEKGYQSTTLQDIIDATGLSKGAVYHHFRSKEEIARKVGDRMGDEMWEPLRRIRACRSCRQCLRCPLQGTGSSAWAALCRT